MNKAFYIIAVAMTAASCNSAVIDDAVRYGRLAVSLSGEPVVEVETRTDGYTQLDPSDAADYLISVYNDGWASSPVKCSEVSSLGVPEGTYTVKAESCTADTAEGKSDDGSYGLGCMHLVGIAENVQVESEKTTDVTIQCDIANALVTVVFDQTCYSSDGNILFTGLEVGLQASDGSDKSASVSAPAACSADGICNYFKPCTLKYTINGTYTSTDKTIDYESETPLTLNAGTHVILSVKVNLENGMLDFSYKYEGSITEINTDQGFNPYN